MPRRKTHAEDSTTAWDIVAAVDVETLQRTVVGVLRQGGAVMLGQTRDNAKLIVTVYLDGEQHKEYCEDASEALKFLAEFGV